MTTSYVGKRIMDDVFYYSLFIMLNGIIIGFILVNWCWGYIFTYFTKYNRSPLKDNIKNTLKDEWYPQSFKIFHSYSVQVTTDVQGTIQFQTSMQDVLIRLSILDQGKEVASNTGKGHVVIPIYFFLANKGEQSLALVVEVTNK